MPDTIFTDQAKTGSPASVSSVEGLKPLTPEEVRKVAAAYVEECVDYRDAELSPHRAKVDKYYRGETDLPVPEGRSRVIVTSVRDGVRSVVPSLARIFTQTDTVGEFYSELEQDQQITKDATQWANGVFWQYGGYKALIEGSTDALKAKAGVVKVTLENRTYVSHLNYNKSALGNVKVEDVTEENDEELVSTKKVKRLIWNFNPLPPEEFLIHHSATCIEYAVCCAHQREETISNLIELGYTYEQLRDIPSSTPINTEDKERKQTFREKDEGLSPEIDPTARMILFTESYCRIDADGDGIAELRRVCMGGDTYKLLSDEPVNFAPYAEFQAELAPHVFYPICLAEDLVQDQDAQTALLRSIIDNTAAVNNPRTEVNEKYVNLDDAKNGKLGAMIRVREMGMINELVTPFVAGQTLPVLNHLQTVSERRSGINRMNQGVDPDVLQSTSRIAAQAAVAAADARIEMMARNIAETGVKNMFRILLKTAIYNLKDAQSINLPEGFKLVNPQMWHLYFSIRTNVGLGSGRIEEKKQALMAVLPIQQQIIQLMGPANPLSSWQNARETIKTLLRLSGIHNYQDYFPYVPPEQLKQLADQQAAQSAELKKKQEEAQQAQQAAMVELVRVEAKKAELKYQTEIAKVQQKAENDIRELRLQVAEISSRNKIEAAKVILQDDRERDKNDMDFAIDVAKVGVEDDKVKATEAKVAAQRTAPNGGALQ